VTLKYRLLQPRYQRHFALQEIDYDDKAKCGVQFWSFFRKHPHIDKIATGLTKLYWR
jgi:hypothetical protein